MVHLIKPPFRSFMPAVLAGVLALAAQGGATPVHATTLTVCPAGLPRCGYSTIQSAIAAASAGDTILIAAGSYGEHLTLGTSVTLAGVGRGGAVVDGGNHGTVVTINAGAAVTLTNLILQHGSNRNGGGGLLNNGTATLISSTVTGNSSQGGDIGSGQGGGINNNGVLTLLASTISGNSAEEAGGIFNVGAMTVLNSTISANSTDSFGGGLENFGPLTVLNSTIADNSAIYGGGINNVGTLTLSNSTIAGNTAAGNGGGIVASSIDGALVALKNTILAGNSADFSAPDCEGTLNSQDYNLIQNTQGCTISGGGDDLIGLAANLGPLQNNGGPTLTMALLAGSPAIDAGNPAGCTSPSGSTLHADQRVYPRPSPRGGRCDIGAFELQQ